MRIVILWQGMSGYLLSWIDALTSKGCSVLLIHTNKSHDAPFELKIPDTNLTSHALDNLTRKQVLKKVYDFNPDVVLISSWHIFKYRYTARRISVPRVLCMDNQWHSTFKQWLGILTRYFVIRPLYDRALVPGLQQRIFAQKLGFKNYKIWNGMLSADSRTFTSTVYTRRNEFLFVGRIVKEKGIDILVSAYSEYRKISDNPFTLRICGVGNLVSLIKGQEGIIWEGFKHPHELPPIYGSSKIFVMPSIFEPWGVAIHEATLSGLMIIASDACGAAESLVEDGWNGLIIPRGNIEALTNAMLQAERQVLDDFRTISHNSKALSGRYSPDLWAENLIRRVSQEFQK